MTRGRPQQDGLSWFPLNTKLDDSFRLIEAEYGLKGFAVVVKLFQKIYGDKGYYCEWDHDVSVLFASDNKLSGTFVSQVIDKAIQKEIFDRTMFEKYRILTSRGIQRRYFKNGRRPVNRIRQEYLLVECTQEGIIATENGFFATENGFFVTKNPPKDLDSDLDSDLDEEAEPTAPTLENIKAFVKAEGLKIDPNRFFTYYNSRKWQRGKHSIRSVWKEVAREWNATEKKPTKETSFSIEDMEALAK